MKERWLRLYYDWPGVAYYRERKRKKIARRKIFWTSMAIVIAFGYFSLYFIKPLLVQLIDPVMGYTLHYVIVLVAGAIGGKAAGKIVSKKNLW